MKKAFAIWLTGLPSSGKTTLARRLKAKISGMGYRVVILESDKLRRLLTPNPKYTEEEREYFYRSMAVIGKYLVDAGVCVIFDATANRRKYRDYARRIIKDFMEIYLNCPLKVCMERDVKGLYREALEGKIKTLPGLQAPYEEPLNPDVTVDTHRYTVRESTDIIMDKITERFLG
jgi:adenylylsulfate kinase